MYFKYITDPLQILSNYFMVWIRRTTMFFDTRYFIFYIFSSHF